MTNRASNYTSDLSKIINLNNCDGKIAEQFVEQATQVKNEIIRLDLFSDNTEFISLGHNCNTAHYLREIGLRKGAYPFDWVFSSAEIIVDALQDSFESFMDRSQWDQHCKVNNVTHQRYHEYFFAHKNPLTNQEDYDYYQRACRRFIEQLATQKPLCFVITLITEPEKRPGWAMGFTQRFAPPHSQTIESVRHLIEQIKNTHPNSTFVVIEHYTEMPVDASIVSVETDLIQLRFCATGKNTGKKYSDEIDDLCFKIMLSGLNPNKVDAITPSTKSA
jgi:hypothetical protein